MSARRTSVVYRILTARLGAALAGGARLSDGCTALQCILTLYWSCFLGIFVSLSKAGSKTGEQVTGFEVFGVESNNLGKGIAVGADEGSGSCDRSEGGREVHFVIFRSLVLLDY
jgi:hypothetical protein